MPGKPDTRKGNSARKNRALKDREPKIFENTKTCLILYGRNVNETLKKFAVDLSKIMQPFYKRLQFKNDITPFDNVDELERLCKRNDCSLFCFLSTSKKKPNNVVLGRLFDYHVLDMFEFNLDTFISSTDLSSPKPQISAKPLLIFQGDGWSNDIFLTAIKSLFLDFFRGQEVKKVAHTAVKHCFVFTANAADVVTAEPDTPDGKRTIIFRSYTFKSDTEKRLKLLPMGPCADFILRRCNFPDRAEMRRAMIRPRTQADDAVTTRRNIAKNADFDDLGNLIGTVYTEKQDFSKLNLRKFKALRSTKQNNEFVENDNTDNQEQKISNDADSSLSEEVVGNNEENDSKYYYEEEENSMIDGDEDENEEYYESEEETEEEK